MLRGRRQRREIARRIEAVPFWWHSIDVGGVTTPGVKKPPDLARELAAADLPDVRGKSVLDIGGWEASSPSRRRRPAPSAWR